jgi:hypothetical protein
LPSTFMSLDLVEFSRSFNSALAELIEGGDQALRTNDDPRPQIRLLSSDTPDWNL